MTSEKIRQIEEEIQKLKDKIERYQTRLKELEAKKTETENLMIVRSIRAINLSPDELRILLKKISGIQTRAQKQHKDETEEPDNESKPY